MKSAGVPGAGVETKAGVEGAGVKALELKEPLEAGGDGDAAGVEGAGVFEAGFDAPLAFAFDFATPMAAAKRLISSSSSE